MFALLVTALILAAMYYLKLGVFEMLSKHFIQMTVVAMLFAILFGVISHVAARRLPPKLVSHRANTGQFHHVIGSEQHLTYLSFLQRSALLAVHRCICHSRVRPSFVRFRCFVKTNEAMIMRF